ncbi:hypothetical protein Leryth_015471 [Lithospermum erythrorhizon]|nr:hypothetical protein Leryth_015471 [Lithospermum erythrorhizon]
MILKLANYCLLYVQLSTHAYDRNQLDGRACIQIHDVILSLILISGPFGSISIHFDDPASNGAGIRILFLGPFSSGSRLLEEPE